MFYSTVLIAATTLGSLARAQGTEPPLTVDPGSVDISTRNSWCISQTGNCPLICGSEGAYPNRCYADTLTYECECNDGSTPNITDYSSTLPSLVCQEYVAQCVNQAGNNLTGLTECRDIECGSRKPSAASDSDSDSDSDSSPSTSASGAASGSASGSPSNTGSASSSTPTDNAAAALGMANNYGSGILAASLLAIFGLAL